MPSFIKSVALTGFIAGTLDIVSATIHFLVRHPDMGISDLLVRIASGAFGKEAFNGNPLMPWLGLLFHYIIAYSFTLLFFILYGRIAVIRKQPLVSGLLYGIVVWSIMQFIVLPLTYIPTGTLNLANINTLIGIVILMIMIGIPAALGARRYYGAD